ncbi:calcium-binding protein [Neogemmobacter tilapiae]|uniref:Calcium-binding protein n=1 Tax=Neogemmobacter tilapiae TaxID=875041 RepID=A0A918WHU9_9RHOB|nr:calcium-binding protein [Gemmobacter tilapiae]GHC47830.1 hypothetical protein GCM10007315_07150 [Gemmobacter tilapiae]
MAVIRYFSPAAGQGANTFTFLTALFGGVTAFRLTDTALTITSSQVKSTLAGTELGYAFEAGYPFPVPFKGDLDSLTMKLNDSSNKIIFTIENWDAKAKRMFDAFEDEDELAFFNVFLGGNDRIFGTGFSDALTGMSGHDIIKSGKAIDAVSGGNGNDSLYGGAGNDQLAGETGNDLLVGGAGGDVMNGGIGSDRFLFNTAAIDGVLDNIGDFNTAADKILLDNDAFAALGAAGTLRAGQFRLGTDATTLSQRIVYDAASGHLYYDRDGSGAAAKVLLAAMDDGLALTRAHFQILD